MTNKINGIEVSECKYFNKVVNEEPYCNIDEEHLYTCSSDENCYFKQLKRLQEENEELKETAEGLLKIQYALADSCNKYSKALEEIREISKQCMTKDLCSIDCDYADRCYIEDEEVPTYDICKLIIEKINEVLNEQK